MPDTLADVVRRQLQQARAPVTAARDLLQDRAALRLLAEGVEELLLALELNALNRDPAAADRVDAAMATLVSMGVKMPPRTLAAMAAMDQTPTCVRGKPTPDFTDHSVQIFTTVLPGALNKHGAYICGPCRAGDHLGVQHAGSQHASCQCSCDGVHDGRGGRRQP